MENFLMDGSSWHYLNSLISFNIIQDKQPDIIPWYDVTGGDVMPFMRCSYQNTDPKCHQDFRSNCSLQWHMEDRGIHEIKP